MLRKILFTIAAVLMTCSMAFAETTIVIAHDATWPPMEFVNKDKQIVGFSVDYMDAIAEEMNITIEHKNVAWDGIFAGLANGRYDMIASSVSITPERQEKFDFSAPYYEVKQGVIMAKGASAGSLDDLKGKTVGGQIGTTGVLMIGRVDGVNAKSFDEVGHAVEALFTGRIDAVICDDVTAYDFVLNNEKYAEKLSVAFVADAPEPEYYGFVVQKGNKKLLDILNKGIEAVKAKGIDSKLRDKWIGK